MNWLFFSIFAWKLTEIMKLRSLLLVSLMVVSLSSDAQISLPDSLLSVNKAYTYFFTSPDTAQVILNRVRERQLDAESYIDFAEGDLNFYMRQYLKAKPLYQKVRENPSVRDSSFVQMMVLKRLMDCCDALYQEEELIENMYQLRQKAKTAHNKAFEAMTYFMSGKIHHYHGQKEKGYKACLDAVEMLKASDYPFKHIELRVCYLELLKMYTRDGRYDDALRMSHLQETEALLPSPALIKNARDRGLREVYSLRASMLAKAGRMNEADLAYASWLRTTTANVIDDMNLFDYLHLSRHYDEALRIINDYRTILEERGDTISYRYLSVINKEALLLVDMGEYERAAGFGRRVGDVSQNIYIHASGVQMQTTYELLEEQSKSHRKTLWLSLLLGFVLVVILLSLVILYYVRKIRLRNAHLLHVLNILDAYRRAVINGASLTSPEVVAAVDELRSVQLPEDLKPAVEQPDDEDRRLFLEMDTQVTRDRLFLKPGLGRDDLMRLIGVDKNRFGKMMSKYSDASNTSVYINAKRVEYGAKLLLDHPEYTVATVAQECGMSNTVTFNRIFKDVYSMTPSEYREKMNSAFSPQN